MILYAIDPGVHSSAVAMFRDGALMATAETHRWSYGSWAGPGSIVVEIPRVYPKDPRKGNDLIDLAAAGMRLAGQIEASCIGHVVLTTVFPRQWKGQIPKPIHHSRMITKLSPIEKDILLALKPDLDQHIRTACETYAETRQVRGYSNRIHNVLDAVALGLTKIGRL